MVKPPSSPSDPFPAPTPLTPPNSTSPPVLDYWGKGRNGCDPSTPLFGPDTHTYLLFTTTTPTHRPPVGVDWKGIGRSPLAFRRPRLDTPSDGGLGQDERRDVSPGLPSSQKRRRQRGGMSEHPPPSVHEATGTSPGRLSTGPTVRPEPEGPRDPPEGEGRVGWRL